MELRFIGICTRAWNPIRFDAISVKGERWREIITCVFDFWFLFFFWRGDWKDETSWIFFFFFFQKLFTNINDRVTKFYDPVNYVRTIRLFLNIKAKDK